MNDTKLWLCGMIAGDRTMLEKTVLPAAPYFDGIIFVVDDRAKLEDIQWLNSIKKEGKIIVKKWVNDHSHTSNEVLFSGIMNFPEFFVWVDQSDELNLAFVKRMREDIFYWKKNAIGMVCIDHPFIVQYHDGLRFQSSPHWSLASPLGRVLDLKSVPQYRKENFVFNRRNELKSIFPSKYWFEYPNCSNHTGLLYGQFGDKIYSYHEMLRIQFRFFCKNDLKIDLTMDALEKYLSNNLGNYPQFVEDILEIEVSMKDFFRLNVLKQPADYIIHCRHNWSYFEWKRNPDKIQKNNDGYVGVMNTYWIQQGKEMQ